MANLPLFFFLGLGNLNNGANYGLWYVNANNALSNANWNIGGRQSGYGTSLSSHVYLACARARRGLPS